MGLDQLAESILSELDAESLSRAELVCREWRHVIANGLIWKRLIERRVARDPLWAGLARKRSWYVRGDTRDSQLHRKLKNIVKIVVFRGRWIQMRDAQLNLDS